MDEVTINSLRKSLKQYAVPNDRRAVWQLANTLIPYIALWIILVYMIRNGFALILTLPFIIAAAFFLVRIFIFCHDCVHGSFFTSPRANKIIGYVTGIMAFTPFSYWQHDHLIHHGTYADLDHRGVGDISTLTVEEYRALSRTKRLAYRLYRNPFVFLGIGPSYTFLLAQRLPHKRGGKSERLSAMITNLALLGIMLMASLTMGLGTYLLIQVPIMLIAGAMGIWLFYVQHQFEGVYWARHENWDPVKAALLGCSYYKLPKLLQWLTGNIGLHHVHHVLPRIPNYHLQQSLDASPVMQTVRPLTLRESFKSVWLNLWDEKQQKLVSFRSLKELGH
ncbi:fatty acid desaturase [Desulfocurvibacter africanus]|uniref:fatty acid desaturase n=1 Tax=Desulfocurvibacter africanus TaxID=873 RepID=UPI00192B1235|nr:fatty acid desaturase [Desulfocurvibacter africanus]